MYVSNLLNSDFGYLSFDGDQILISRWLMYRMNDYIVQRFNNGLIVDVYMNKM